MLAAGEAVHVLAQWAYRNPMYSSAVNLIFL